MNKIEKRNVTIVKLEGSILESDCKNLDSSLSKILIESSRNTIIDLTDVNHICSLALGLLVSFKKKYSEKNGDIRLVIIDDDMLELFEITMLNKVFEIFSDVKTAENSFEH